MKNHKDILKDCSGINRDEEGNEVYLWWEIKDAMEIAAKQAFEAARKTTMRPRDSYEPPETYLNFKDFLKEVNDEN